MKAKTIAGLLLVALGVAALALRTVSWTRKTHRAKVAGFELSLKEKESVEVPVWAGAGAVVSGVVLILAGARRGA